ncbi:mannosyltransferase [Pholiota conissans]|uniref:GPI mannosyltransferase 2 n=1 Tax=Pholiota conissans TaxID=109636 RepID=A0A9P5ZAI3_9AGAR|nr:mannosyltransferase [Pholiota conissans]
MNATTKGEERHRALLFRYSIAVRLFSFALLHIASTWLPLFDASPLLVQDITTLEYPLLRWDAFHFHHIAAKGYVYEHEWAFFPMMRALSLLQPSSLRGPKHLLLIGMTAALACDSSQLLYTLSLFHLRSADLAFLASVLSLIPTSPVTAYFVPINEPFFTHFSYRGMLCCTRRKWAKAAFWFALAGALRSNGIFLGGFVLWGLLVQPFAVGKMPTIKTFTKAIALISIIVAPFMTYQAYAYITFCTRFEGPIPEWCSWFPPAIYTYVQSKYWNVGVLRYWTVSQLPNFVIASPTLLLIFAFILHHFRNGSLLQLSKSKSCSQVNTVFQNSSITPHALHATIFASILLFASHTQIVLRLASSMPLIYWAAAWLVTYHPTFGKAWVLWSVLWGTTSIVLWAAFLPPA